VRRPGEQFRIRSGADIFSPGEEISVRGGSARIETVSARGNDWVEYEATMLEPPPPAVVEAPKPWWWRLLFAIGLVRR